MRHTIVTVFMTASLAFCAGACSKKDKAEKDENAKPTDKTAEAPPTDNANKPAPAPTVTIASAEDLANRVQQCIGFANAGDLAKLGSCYAEDAVLNRVDMEPAMPVKGRAQLVQMTEMYQKSFSEAHSELHLILVKDKSEAVTFGLGTAKHTGDFMGMKASGKKIGMMEAMHLKANGQGQITNEDVYFDMGTWFAQVTGAPMPHRTAMARTGKAPEVVVAQGDKTEADNLALIKAVHDALNAHDAKKVMALYHADTTFSHQGHHEDVTGTDKIGKMLGELLAMTSDVTFTPAWTFAAGDYVVAHVNNKGTHDGPLPMGTGPATNKPFDVNELNIYKIADGKVKHQWVFGNGLAMATQLGLVDMESMMKAKQ